MLGVKYLKDDFYQEKNKIIENVIKKYIESKNDENLNKKDLLKIKSNCESILCKIMVENGFKEPGEEFINMDIEFFNEYGEFDEKKSDQFQKMMLRYYALQDVNWTYAGTTGSFSQITKNSLKEKGYSWKELLPIELKRKFTENENKKNKSEKANISKLFIYPNGGISDKYIPEKAKITFNDLKDNSGFNWSESFSPDNKVVKDGWISGLNKNGEWEKMFIGDTSTSSEKISKVFITGDSKKNNYPLTFLQIQDTDDIILFDEENNLMEPEVKKYFSVSGELYGIQKTDINETVKSLNNTLKKQEVKKIKAVVLKNTDEKTISYYKKKLKDFVTDNTIFYTKNDKKLIKQLDKIKKDQQEKKISQIILTGFSSLSQKGIKGEELYNGLTPALSQSTYDKTLKIFDSQEDLDTFVNTPGIAEELDDDTKSYLQNVQVPQEKKTEFSNAAQNILHNYNNIFKHTPLTKQEILKKAYDVIVNDKKDLKKVPVTGEKNLVDFISSNTALSSMTAIPSFKNAFKSEKDYFDIYNNDDLNTWAVKKLKSQNITEDSQKELINMISSQTVKDQDKSAYSYAVQNTFDSFKEIQTSTGMKPTEVLRAINDIVLGKNIEPLYKKKRIYFENNFADLVKEASKKNPNKVSVTKDDFYLSHKVNSVGNIPNYLDETELDELIYSNTMKNAGIDEQNQQQIVNHLRNVNIPMSKTNFFNSNLKSIINNYSKNLAPKGITPINAVKALSLASQGNYNKIDNDLKNSIFKNIPSQTSQPKTLNYNLLNKQDFNTFIKKPQFKESGLSKSSFEQLINTHQDAYKSINTDYIKQIPVQYKNEIGDGSSLHSSNFTNDELTKNILNTSLLNASTSPNNVFNLGYVSTTKGSSMPVINFFNQDNNSFNINKPNLNLQNTLSQSFNTTPIQPSISTSGINTPEITNYSFANPLAYITRSPGLEAEKFMNTQNMDTHSFNQNAININKQQIIHQDPKMQKIQENYEKDKQMLARSESQQILTGTGGDFKGVKSGGNEISDITDTIVDEILDDISNEI